MAARKHSGRRPGDSGTREAIARAARRQFAESGFDRPSLRSIASEAGVDPTLVSHFYGSKQELFASVVELPFDAAEALPAILEGAKAGVGLRLATFVVDTLESSEGNRRIVGIIRAAASEPEAAKLVRALISERVIGALVAALCVEDAAFRASLVASQVVGLAMARYVVGIEPLASAQPADVVAAIAPTLQRYLVGPLP